MTRLTADRFLIATGTRTYRPDNVPFNGSTIIDSDEFLELGQIPRSLIVVGAGVIGVEYATMFSALDVRVALIEPRDSFLDFIDRTIIQEFTHQTRENGVDLRLGSAITRVEDAGEHVEMTLANGRHVRAEMLLFAAGRMGATDKLNLKTVGLETDHRGRIEVDRKSDQTAVPHIYAAGDAIGHPSLASTSLQQGRVAACHALETPTLPESPWFPYGIYSVPEISTCGMSEEEMTQRGIPYEVGVARFRESGSGLRQLPAWHCHRPVPAALLEAPLGHASHLQPEIAQHTTQRQLEVDDGLLDRLARGQQRAHFLRRDRFAMDLPEPAHLQKPRDPFGIPPVGLDRHRLERALHLSCFHQNRVEPGFDEVPMEPL